MRGFTDRALILFSDLDEYLDRSDVYRQSYRKAVDNLVTYLKSAGISHDCLLTDRLACVFSFPHPRWIATGTREDMFFMHNFCDVPKHDAVPLKEELAAKVRKKFPIKRGLEPKERFDIVAKRVAMAERDIIASYNFVIVFGTAYSVKSKPNDGRAVLRINDRHFYTSMELSGSSVPINDFMQIPYANISLSEWGIYTNE